MKKLLLLLLLSLFIFSACKDDDEPEQEQVTPTTFIKEETEIVAVNDNTITLTGSQTEIEANDIIVSGANGNAPNGFLRKVVSISTSNGNTILQTQRTSIAEAVKYFFEEGEVYQDSFSYTFSDNDFIGRSPSGTNTTPISLDIDETITTDQGGVPIDLNITGNLIITPNVVADIKIGLVNFTPVFEKFIFSISTENEFNITLNSELSLAFDTGDIRLGRFETAPITLFIGIPVVIRPQFTLYIGSNGDLTANIIYTYNNNSTAIAGITYDDGWQYLSNNGFAIDSQSSTATASVTGNLKAYVKPEFSLALYDNSVVSAGINVEPYARFEGAINSTEYSWSVNGGIDTGAYFKAFDFGFTTLIDKTWENLIEIPEWEIASGFYNIATITNPTPTDNSTITTQPISFSWQPNDFTISPTYEILFGTDINSLTPIGTTNNTNFIHPNNTLSDDTYYWKIIAKDGNGDIITESLFFSFILDTSSTNVSSVHTPNPTNTSTDIAINGNLSFSEGTNTPSDATYKLYFDTSSNPNTVLTLSSGTTSHTYSNLQNDTSYYWKVETISNSGSVLATSPIWSFTTLSNNSVPTVSTVTISDITQTTATSGGNVTNEGGSNVTEKGIVWSTTPNPTITDNPTADGIGIGNFISSLTGLTENTTYYVKAYATNSFGTAFGTEIEFTTEGCIGGIYNGSITLSSQEEVDDFGSNCYEEIAGNLIINDNNQSITNLSSLSSLITVSQNLDIVNNPILTNLNGLNNIINIGSNTDPIQGHNLKIWGNSLLENLNDLNTNLNISSSIIIRENPLITNVDIFSNITVIIGGLSIINNNSLVNINGFSNVTTIGLGTNGYNGYGGALVIQNNSSLQNIDGLSSVSEIKNETSINTNPLITNLNGLSNLNATRLFNISYNNNLTNIDALNNFNSGNVPIKLNNNNSLTSLNGIDNSIWYSVQIINNDNLSNLSGLHLNPNVGYIIIKDNDLIPNLNVLSNVISVYYNIEVSDNNSLNNIDGLNSLTSINGYGGTTMKFNNNSSLLNLNGLSNIVTTNNSNLEIGDNSVLNNLCGVTNMVNSGINSYSVINNAYNPTEQDIIDGNCSQ